ncbi:Uncharacterised protein [Sphingobacterium daejeonense]|nr:Uncharacterised protein [Sphingobacterium daejeonense]
MVLQVSLDLLMKVFSFYHIDGWWRHQPWRHWDTNHGVIGTPTMASLGHQPWRRWTPTMASLDTNHGVVGHQPWRHWDTNHGVVGTPTMASLGQQPWRRWDTNHGVVGHQPWRHWDSNHPILTEMPR